MNRWMKDFCQKNRRVLGKVNGALHTGYFVQIALHYDGVISATCFGLAGFAFIFVVFYEGVE